VVALGFSAIFVKWANVPGAVSGFYRVALAAAVMALPVAPRVRREWPLPRRQLGLAALAGLFFAADMATWNTAVLITNAANATLFGNTAPLWVGLGALVLFRERLRAGFWVGLLLAMLGTAIILGTDFLTHPRLGVGDVLSLLAGVFYAGFFLTTQRARRGLSAMTSWWVSAVASAAALLAAALALRQPLTGHPLPSYVSLLALALIPQVGGYLAINYALGHLPASLVAPTLLGQPVLTALVAIPLLGERLHAAQVVGGLVVLGGIGLVHRAGAGEPGRQSADGSRQKADVGPHRETTGEQRGA
jgi:drug/metabolite transporter (DMT)-like permease